MEAVKRVDAMRKSFSLFLFILLVFPASAYALGIGPTDMEVEFQPNLVFKQTVYVVNSESFDLPIKMSVEGDLKENMTLSVYDFVLGPRGTAAGVGYVEVTLNMPGKLDRPGSYKTYIYATENTPATTKGIGAKIRMGTPVIVYVPYPGKYIELSIRVENPKVNETIRFTADTINRGNETITSAQAIFTLYDSQDQVVTTLPTDSIQISPSERVAFVKEWLATNVRPGKYKVMARVSYDDYRTEKTEEFMIGSPTARILGVNAAPIPEGIIGRISANVSSDWNDRITGAYMVLDMKKGDFSTGVRSETFDLERWNQRSVDMFWDTAKSDGPGEYVGNATLYYFNRTASADFTVTVAPKGFQLTPETMLIIAVIVLVAMFAVMVFFFRRKDGAKSVQKRLM
jgi:hypothetical protein